MKLWWNPVSQHSQRVAILAAELGINIEHISLDPMKGENRTPQYLALNPMGKIPTYQDDDGWALYESGAINMYLATKYGNTAIWPTEARERADVTRWMFWSTAHFDPPAGSLFWEKFFVPMQKGTPNQDKIAQATKDLERYLPVLNARLEGREYICRTYTLADIHVGTFARSLTLPQVGYDLKAAPHVGAWLNRLNSRPTWKSVFAR